MSFLAGEVNHNHQVAMKIFAVFLSCQRIASSPLPVVGGRRSADLNIFSIYSLFSGRIKYLQWEGLKMLNTILQVLGLIVSSGILLAIYQNYSEIKTQNRIRLREITEQRFKSILIFMDIILHPSHIPYITDEIEIKTLVSKNPRDNNDQVKEYFMNRVRANMLNLYMYTEGTLIQKIEDFLLSPDEEKFIGVAKTMREILWK